jgi:hypothetical protein
VAEDGVSGQFADLRAWLTHAEVTEYEVFMSPERYVPEGMTFETFEARLPSVAERVARIHELAQTATERRDAGQPPIIPELLEPGGGEVVI